MASPRTIQTALRNRRVLKDSIYSKTQRFYESSSLIISLSVVFLKYVRIVLWASTVRRKHRAGQR